MLTAMGMEQRRYPRESHDSVLELLDEAGRRLEGISRLVDYSTVGLQFSSSLNFARGARIRARLRLMKQGRLEVTGNVVWLKKKGNATLYGVAFDSLRPL